MSRFFLHQATGDRKICLYDRCMGRKCRLCILIIPTYIEHNQKQKQHHRRIHEIFHLYFLLL